MNEEIEELLRNYDDGDIKHIIMEDEDIYEQHFRWEYQLESVSEMGSVFRKVMPDN